MVSEYQAITCNVLIINVIKITFWLRRGASPVARSTK